ncbi:MAG: asparagine synthase (glutamine-hydrolyzing), partial [Actinobacteria bacterium]|nr:asparagine synthase (glutamine-hydrolyzing) [Actinomycetota bacterium]
PMEKGFECLKRLRGMFAFAIWDEKEKILFLARDRIGKKPLVYSLLNNSIIFASEIKAILQHPGIKKEVSPESIDMFLSYQAIPSPYTIFKQIHKLPPASYLIWKNGNVKIEKYWDVDFSKKIILKSLEDYGELLWQKLNEATKIRMISDVPLGAFLSGGIDSSTIVGIMSRFSSQSVKTFSIGFGEKDYSELEYAKTVATYFGTDHHQFIVKPDIIEILPKLVWHYNEPFGDSSMVPTYYVAQQTKKYVTVALNGDGGDENFAGYTRYWQTILMQKFFSMYVKSPGIIRKNLPALLQKNDRFSSNNVLKVIPYLEEIEKYYKNNIYTRILTSFSESKKDGLYSHDMKEELKNFTSIDYLQSIWEKTGNFCFLEKMLYTDFHFYLPEVLMVKMDIATMSNALEGRSPFLDHLFIETIAQFPAGLKFRRWTSKYILKQKLKRFLPEKILKRKKMGFGIPLSEWFRGEMKEYMSKILLSERCLSRGYFIPDRIKQIVTEHISGKANHSGRLWLLLNLEIWHKIFIDGENI